MKSTARAATLVFAFAAAVLAQPLWAVDRPASMIDPLLGLSYDPDLNHFETFPASTAATEALGQGDHWIYASYANGDTRYYVISGYHKGRAALGESPQEPDFGRVIRVVGKRIETLGSPDQLFDRDAILPQDVVAGLVRDASARYTAAFDGAYKLNRAILAQNTTANDYAPVLIKTMSQWGVQLKAMQQADSRR